jgi:plastocyanin
MAVAPCGAASDYESGATITFPGADSMSYAPKCLKTTVGSPITFMPMAGATFEMFPLSPSRLRGNTADSAIQSFESATATSKAFTFGTPGSYAYYCRRGGSDEDGSGMAGVIWVE